jgi:DNA-binding MurR/RpiR family transcriptional regulator
MIETRTTCPHSRRVTHLAKAREVFDIEIAALRKVRTLLDKSFDAAVDLVANALSNRGKIVVVGIGKSGNVGSKIAATLTKFPDIKIPTAKLIERANENGGPDNVTAVLVRWTQ